MVDHVSEEFKMIAMYNHKGGVGKTTYSFTIAWALAMKGAKVIMFDLDPQFSLSWAVLRRWVRKSGYDWYQYLAQEPTIHTIKQALDSAEAGEVRPAETVRVATFTGSEDSEDYDYGDSWLDLCVGSEEMLDFETRLAAATINLAQGHNDVTVCALYQVVRRTMEHRGADFAILDLSPSFDFMNKNAIAFSHYLITPCSADEFSANALESLKDKLLRDILRARPELGVANQRTLFQQVNVRRDQRMTVLRQFLTENEVRARSECQKIPIPRVRYIGYGISNYKFMGQGDVAAYENRKSSIARKVEAIHDALQPGEGLLAAQIHRWGELPGAYKLYDIPDYRSAGQHAQLLSIPAPFITNAAEYRVTRKSTRATLDNLMWWRAEMDNCARKILEIAGLGHLSLRTCYEQNVHIPLGKVGGLADPIEDHDVSNLDEVLKY